MDLRPKIASDIVEALLNELGWSEPQRKEVREQWVNIALTKLASSSLPLESMGDPNPEMVEKFYAKYPYLRQRVEKAKAKARSIVPDITFSLEVSYDPEGCSVCSENNHLVLNILCQDHHWDIFHTEEYETYDLEDRENSELFITMLRDVCNYEGIAVQR